MVPSHGKCRTAYRGRGARGADKGAPGIGTPATRAEIIQKLVRIGYLNLEQKTQILTPESLGEMVLEVVYMTVPALLNPKMTANW